MTRAVLLALCLVACDPHASAPAADAGADVEQLEAPAGADMNQARRSDGSPFQGSDAGPEAAADAAPIDCACPAGSMLSRATGTCITCDRFGACRTVAPAPCQDGGPG